MKRYHKGSMHITYLKAKDERRHKSNCLFHLDDGNCGKRGFCNGSAHCTSYRKKTGKEKKNTKKARKLGIQIDDIITIRDFETREDICLCIVDSGDGDILNDKISIDSELGKKVIGKYKGDSIKVSENGEICYKIIDWKRAKSNR